MQAADLLVDAFGRVRSTVHAAVEELTGDLDRVVDEAWNPPGTLAVRLVSVVNDDLQHAGQAALVRGIVERGNRS